MANGVFDSYASVELTPNVSIKITAGSSDSYANTGLSSSISIKSTAYVPTIASSTTVTVKQKFSD